MDCIAGAGTAGEAIQFNLWDCSRELQLWCKRGRPLQKPGLESIRALECLREQELLTLSGGLDAVDILPGNLQAQRARQPPDLSRVRPCNCFQALEAESATTPRESRGSQERARQPSGPSGVRPCHGFRASASQSASE